MYLRSSRAYLALSEESTWVRVRVRVRVGVGVRIRVGFRGRGRVRFGVGVGVGVGVRVRVRVESATWMTNAVVRDWGRGTGSPRHRGWGRRTWTSAGVVEGGTAIVAVMITWG